MGNTNFPNDNLFIDEVKINLNIFHVFLLDHVDWEVDIADVVTVDGCTPCEWVVELLKKLMDLGCLNHTISIDAILLVGTRAGGHGLRLGGEREMCIVPFL